MLKLQERLLIISIILHHLYIIFLNTSSIHGLVVLDKLIWTGLLSLFLIVIVYYYLREPTSTWYEKSLYFAIILGVLGSILRTFGFSTQIVSYAFLLIIIAILTTIPLIIHHHSQLRVMLLAIYTLEFIILLSRILKISNVIPVLGPIVELIIVFAIIYYNYSLGFQYDELFIIVLFTYVGWQVGIFVANLGSKVPFLIISTMFEQMLSVGQYNIAVGFFEFDTSFFLSLHLAQMFNLIIIQILSRRSIRAIAVILTGIDMTYPPIMAMRAIAILAFLRNTLSPFGETKKMSQKPFIESAESIEIDQSQVTEDDSEDLDNPNDIGDLDEEMVDAEVELGDSESNPVSQSKDDLSDSSNLEQ